MQVFLDNLISMLPHIQAGKVRALAVASEQRVAQLPDVPTLAEVGYPQLNMSSWTGLAAPAGTPAPVVQALFKAVRQAATAPAMVSSLQDRGVTPPEEMSRLRGHDVRPPQALWRGGAQDGHRRRVSC